MSPTEGHFVTCPRTNKVYPRLRLSDLVTCARCGGFIDTRHEDWLDIPAHPTCPEAATP